MPGSFSATNGYLTTVATLLDYTRTEFPNHTVEVWHPDGWTMPVAPDERGVPRTAPSGESRPEAFDDPLDPLDPSLKAVTPSPGRGDGADAPPDDSASMETLVASMPLGDHTVVAHVIGSAAAIEMLERLREDGWQRAAAVLVCPAAPSVVPHGEENRNAVTDLPDRRVVTIALIGAVLGAAAAGLLGWAIGHSAATGIVTAGFGAILGAVVGAMLGGLGRHAGSQAWSQPHAPGRTMAVVAAFASDEQTAIDAVHAMQVFEPQDIRLVSATGAWRLPLS